MEVSLVVLYLAVDTAGCNLKLIKLLPSLVLPGPLTTIDHTPIGVSNYDAVNIIVEA
jgi:hypothetical protein